ncbi:MAG: SIR2 family protein, partial [Bacillota bacterium]
MIIKKKMNHQKKIVYLFGTGVTQAEIKLKGGTSGVLMRDVKDEILRKIEKDKIKNLVDIRNELTSEYADVEHLITLYESTGIPKHERIAKHLKRLFKEVVQERTNKLKPTLLLALIDMHEIQKLNEELVGILTLNYEDMLEQAIQDVKGGINYSIDISYTKNSYLQKREIFPLLKLHGSFNWANEFPITLTNDKKTKDTDHALWIPPGVEKRKERYPFSIIWGRAKEILNCDVLRV